LFSSLDNSIYGSKIYNYWLPRLPRPLRKNERKGRFWNSPIARLKEFKYQNIYNQSKEQQKKSEKKDEWRSLNRSDRH
jgi:hypothetical protein